MRKLFTLAALLCLAAGLRAEASAYVPRTGTVKAAGLELSLDDVLFTPKKDYVHVIVNVYPYAAKIKALKLKGFAPLAEALIKDEAAKRFPQQKTFKLDIVELSQKDQYGNPRWETIEIKERYKGERKKEKLKVTKTDGPTVIK